MTERASSVRLATVTFLVREYGEAIAFFVDRLGFRLLEDRDLGGGKRWVVVAPCAQAGAALLLARAVTSDQAAAVGRQAGGRAAQRGPLAAGGHAVRQPPCGAGSYDAWR